MSTRFHIEKLGAQGDGMASTETGPVYIRYALPGETVTAARQKDRAELIAVIEASPARVPPVCRHFGTCGGCAIQHLNNDAYNDWKRAKVVDAMRAKGIDAPVADIVRCAPHTRRRVVLAARRTEAGVLLGYYEALSHRIVDIDENPITRPEIVARLGELRQLGALVAASAEPFRMTVTSTLSGLDIAVEGIAKLDDTARLRAAEFISRAGLARLAVGGETIVEPKKPMVMFGDVAVEPPPGGFVQATAEAEAAMAALVTEHLKGSKRIADLFSGSGTFALRLAAKAEVHAVESDAAALASLDRAARFAPALRRVTTEKRDLFRRPLTVKELERFDGLVFDPPRAGAEDQVKQLARSAIAKVAAVSCNPTTLARDLAILIAGGYRVTSVTPIDQFLWSPHVEAVALLEKPRKRR